MVAPYLDDSGGYFTRSSYLWPCHWQLSIIDLTLSGTNYYRHGSGCRRPNGFKLSGIEKFINFYECIHKLARGWALYHAGLYNDDLEYQLLTHGDKSCKDLRDKIFGVLALVDESAYRGLNPITLLIWETCSCMQQKQY
jgi:hypothetical protein